MNNIQLRFSKNWNKKLDKPFFTTIRQNKGFWQHEQGSEVDIILHGLFLTTGVIRFVVPIKLEDISESLAEFDAGLSKDGLIIMLKRMYGDFIDLQLVGIENLDKNGFGGTNNG